MKMFETLLDSIPKNRSLIVNELELPEDISLTYTWTELDRLEREESLAARSDSALSGADYEGHTASTLSSAPLSRAMTDSEIDYTRYRRLKSRSFSDPWSQMRAALDAFPPGYLASLNSFHNSSTDVSDFSTQLTSYERARRYNEELRLKMERFFEEECRVFTPDDPGLLALEDALESLDLKVTSLDFKGL
ncbi:uncharacterized protein LOC114364599 [Ostrinia furnacalis]|uniref:uncharacterized protein LOC114364599 n=1 Tax=Ostrinia furnacalis TaxID=93504 RepID=UPI00103C0E46|nr:uncharacterized protein LOC114364599 [Ostrinia furnacalis]